MKNTKSAVCCYFFIKIESKHFDFINKCNTNEYDSFKMCFWESITNNEKLYSKITAVNVEYWHWHSTLLGLSNLVFNFCLTRKCGCYAELLDRQGLIEYHLPKAEKSTYCDCPQHKNDYFYCCLHSKAVVPHRNVVTTDPHHAYS